MKKYTAVYLLSTVVLSGIAFSCSTTQETGPEVVSHDAERKNRLDSVAVVKADTMVVQKKLNQTGNQPATRRDDK